MHTVRPSQLKKYVVVVSSLMIVLLLAVSVPLSPTRAVGVDPVSTRAAVWKADTSAQPVLSPSFMGADQNGNLYVANRGLDGRTYQIVHFGPDGAFVKAWGVTGSGPGEFNWRPANPDGGPDAGFVAADGAGHVYVSDGYNFRVQKFDSDGQFLLQWGSAGEREGQFQPPTAGPISVDPRGNVYVSDFGHVQSFDSQGRYLGAFGSFGTGEGQSQGAGQVGWDSQGNQYVADLLNGRVLKFSAEGDFVQQIGSPGEGDGEFFMPVQVVVDSADRVYVVDNTTRLQVFDADGNFLDKLSRPGNGDGPFEGLASVAIDGRDNLYVQFASAENGVSIYKLSYILSYRPENGVTFHTFRLQ